MKDIRFDGRVAIVTGAGNGMGREYALALAARGAAVLVNDLGGAPTGGGGSPQAADAVVDQIRATGGKAVASYDSVATLGGGLAIANKALDAFGQIDILISNAGIMRTGLLSNLNKDDLEALTATHLHGGFYVTQPAFKEMRRKGYGRIILVSSNGGAFGISGYSAYGAAKAGLIGLMNAVALEGAPHGILCNALLPGAVTRLGTAAAESAATEQGATSEKGLDQNDEAMNEAFGVMLKAMGPEFVTPMVLYLASERCKSTHAIFSAVGARYARAFMGLTEGWLASDEAPPKVEDIDAHFGEIANLKKYSVPLSVSDEMQIVARARSNARRSRLVP